MSPIPHAPQKSGLVPLPSHMFVFCLSVCRLFSSYCLEPEEAAQTPGKSGMLVFNYNKFLESTIL